MADISVIRIAPELNGQDYGVIVYPPLLATPIVVLSTGGGAALEAVTYTAALTADGKLRLTFSVAVVVSETLLAPASYTIGAPAGAVAPTVVTVTAAGTTSTSTVDLVLLGGLVNGGAYTVTVAAGAARGADYTLYSENAADAAGWVGTATGLTVEAVFAVSNVSMRVLFSSTVRQADAGAADDALNPANYTVTGLTVSGVRALSPRYVEIQTTAQVPGQVYPWAVANVKDTAGNAVADSGNVTGFISSVSYPIEAEEGYDTLEIINVIPSPGSAQQPPQPFIYCDVIDSAAMLDLSTVRVSVAGLLVFSGAVGSRFLNGWTGTVANVSNGISVKALAPTQFGEGWLVEVTVSAKNFYGRALKRTWTFSIYEATRIASVSLVDTTHVRIDFNPGVLVSSELTDVTNYVLRRVTTSPAAAPVVSAVAAVSAVPGDVVTYVTLTLEQPVERIARYGVSVQGPYDVFNRIIETEEVVFRGDSI